ncbi:hypothetical protein DXG03_005709 [Asterophora parasitica]|uniref:Uncharacterized protein n=1 Tax=Asterophora parasitica TaxID=117018 RepID=A0A9P7KF59_9AGAR|nr:hypothetical protein DXG03_005709 [Asterophora parasitica]
MAKTPHKAGSTRQASRPARTAAPLRFKFDDEENVDEILSEGEERQYEGDVTGILKEHQLRQAMKNPTRTTEYQAQKKAIYAAARKNAQEISKSGVTYM